MLLDNPFRSDERVRKEVLSLADAGARITLIATADHKVQRAEIVPGIKVHRWIDFELTRPFRSAYYTALEKAAERVAELDFDVLYVHDMYLALLALKIVRRKPSISLVYDMHEYFQELDFSRELEGWFRRFKGHLVHRYLLAQERKLLQQSDLITVPSSPIKNAIQRSFPKKETVVLRNVPDWKQHPSFNKEKNPIRTELGIPESCEVIVHSGNIYMSAEKAKEWVSRILITLPNHHLIFINDRQIGLQLAEFAGTQPWSKRFHRVGFHAYPQEEILKASDVGWMHIESKLKSRLMTSPNRLNEYLFAGIPIVSTLQEEAKSLKKCYGGIHFYNHNNVAELIHLLQNPDQLSKPNPTAINDMNWNIESKGWLHSVIAIKPN